MAGFSTDWLTLREPADHRSRNRQLEEALSARFALREDIRVVDIGCGTGSNLRAMVDLLPGRQSWTLVDYDPSLLSAARAHLRTWADRCSEDADVLHLEKGAKKLIVAFRKADLAADLEAALGDSPDLVTAAAFFDLASKEFIRAVAAAVARRRAVFYTVLTYNGITSWQPRHPSDNQIIAAFHRDQVTDKGLGVAAGPTAPLHLSDQFKLVDYSVQEGDSPWQLGEADRDLIAELLKGHRAAVEKNGAVDAKALASWAAMVRKATVIGHTDTLAIPV